MNHTFRKFSSRAVQHIYQRAKDRGVIFYDDIDRLIYFSIASVMSERYGISIHALSIMITHLHQGGVVKRKESMAKYIQDVGSVFSRAYNHRYSRKGQLFQARFGSSSKTSHKKILELFAYIYNNHVAKEICKHPIEERWCFLAYAKSNNPFSKPIIPNQISNKLKRALSMVSKRRASGTYLRYSDVIRVTNGLSKEEFEQFLDYSIVKYMFIDFEGLTSFYNNYDSMVASFDYVSGSEWQIKEDYDNFSDLDYLALGKIFENNNWDHTMIFNSSQEKLKSIANDLFLRYGLNILAINKYLHIKE